MGKAFYESSAGVNNVLPRSIAAVSLECIINEATFLQRMCDGQAANIRKMADEAKYLQSDRDRLQVVVDQLREMNSNQYNTIRQLQEPDARLQREAAYGRLMARAAGVNIA